MSVTKGDTYVPGSGSSPELLVAATGSNPELLVSLAGDETANFGSTPELSRAVTQRPRPIPTVAHARPTHLQGPIPQVIPPPPPSPRALRQQKQLENQLSLGSSGSPPHVTGRPASPLLPRSHQGSHTLPKSPFVLRRPLQQQHSLPATLFPPAPQTPPSPLPSNSQAQ